MKKSYSHFPNFHSIGRGAASSAAFVSFVGFALLSFGALSAYSQEAPAVSEPAKVSASGAVDVRAIDADSSVWFIPIQGDIEPSVAAFVRREARAAQNSRAAVIVFEIDTFGGRVDTALQISSFIGSIADAKTVAWVRSGPESMGVSWSAGALIALSCSSIYMAGGTSIGAAAPVEIGADGSTEASGEKTVSAVRSQMAALAEKNGHPVAVALAMVDRDIELWEIQVNGETRTATVAETESLERERGDAVKRLALISPAGKLLSLTAGEAVRYRLARGIADDQSALMADLDTSGPAISRKIGFFDKIVALLTTGPVQSLLILLGIVALFLEINTPGFGIPGVIAVVAFLGVFGANALLGSVGSLELILFLIGIGLLAVEIFVIPGFGVTGISGFIAIGVSLILSMQDFLIPANDWQWDLFGRNIIVVSIAIVAAIAGIAIIALAGPKLKMFDRLTLKTSIEGTARDTLAPGVQISIAAPPIDASLVGKSGIAVTTLRPSGKAEIGGSVFVVETDGVFLEEGTAVEVARVRGNQILVKTAAPRG